MTHSAYNDIILIHRKKKANIITEVYRYDKLIVKRFVKTAPFPDTRRVWELEDKALKRLAEMPAPKSYGFTEKTIKGAPEIIYAREFIDGEPIKKFTDDDIPQLAQIMALIHKHGVITRDPSPENFIKTGEGNILFIDFGRSLILNPKNPALNYYVGKELARICHHTLKDEEDTCDDFLKKYFQVLKRSPAGRKLIETIFHLWYRRIAGRNLS